MLNVFFDDFVFRNYATGLYIRIDSCFSLDEDGTLGVAWNYD
jgi:hypothetical protein